MPRYSMTGKNGQLYTIDGPEGLSRERVQAEILKRAPEAGQAKTVFEDYAEEVPILGDLAIGAADIGLGAVQGVAGVTGAVTEAFGADNAASRFFEDIAQGARSWMSSQERGDLAEGERIMKEAEDKGILDQTIAAIRAFSKSPLTLTAQGLGSAAPFIAASALTGGSAAPVALGALAGAGTVKGSIYDSVEAEAIAGGMSKEQAAALASEAQSYLGDNADQIALGAVIGGVASRFGLEPAFARVFGQQIAKRAILRTAASEAGTEAAQAGQERFAGNLAARRAGFDVPLGRGVAGQATLEGIMGGVPGALAGAMGPRAPRQEGEIPPEIREAYDRLPSSPTNEDVADAVSNLMARGIPEDTARTVVQRMAQRKAAEEEYLRKVQEERAAAVAERTAGAEPSAEPDITAPGMVREEQEFTAPSEDPEVVAERLRAYEAQMGGAAQAAPTARPGFDPESFRNVVGEVPSIGQPVEGGHVTDPDYNYRALSQNEIDAIRLEGWALPQDGARKRGANKKHWASGDGKLHYKPDAAIIRTPKEGFTADAPISAQAIEVWNPQSGQFESIQATRSRAYNQRQRTASSVESDLAIYGKMVAAGQLPPTPLVNKLATRLLDLQGTPSMDTLAAGEVGPILQQFFANEAATFNEVAAQKQAAQATPTPTPSRRGPPQPMDLTPERAGSILSDPVALSDYEASGGDVEALYDIAEGTYEGPSVKYSRGRRPVDTATPDMFAGAPLQEAPGVEAKREELAAQRFATDEERLARQEQAAAEMQAGQERVLAMRQREEAQREETLGDIEYALRAQAPENAVYKVVYDPTSNSAPYKLVAETQLGKKPEEVLSAQTLRDFSDQVYGQMMELTPYIPPAPAAIQEIEERETGEQAAPTAATRMIQEFTAEVDAAREAGQIDNLQRSELLQRLQRPNAYRTLPNGRQVPNDAIARFEKEAIDAASAAANAPADQKEALAAASKEANDKLRAAVKNSLLNPARAALKSMVEMRQDEKVGAKMRAEGAKVQQRLGEMEGRDTSAERAEAREAKIDLAQQRVQKYRRGPDKGSLASSTIEDVQSVVDSVTSQWKSGIPVEVVQSIDDIPDAQLRRAIKRDKAEDAEGFVTPDGVIYLVADNLPSAERARAVLFHEGLGHIGLESLFREELDSALDALYKGNAQLRGETDQWLAENPDAYVGDKNRTARALEEVLAERSENGQLKPSLIKRIASIIRNFARRLGLKLAISDADVEAILAAAHERVVTGDKVSAFVKGMRYISGTGAPAAGIKYSKPKTTEATKDELADMDASMSLGLRRATKTRDTYAMADGIGAAIKARKLKPFIKAFKENVAGFTPPSFRTLLGTLPTSGIIDWYGEEIPSLKDIDDLVLRMSNMKANIIKAAEPTAKLLDEFLLRDKDQILAKVQGMSRINSYSPDAHASAADALQNDKVMKEVENFILKNSNDKKLAKQLIEEIKALTVAGKEVRRSAGDTTIDSRALIALANQLRKTAIDNEKVDQQVAQLTEWTRRIRDGHKAWDQLGKIEGGHQLYKEMRAFYKDMFEAELALLDARIDSLTDEKQAKRLRDMRAEMMRETLSPEEAQKAGDIFSNIDANLFQKDYFPFMREGKYYLRVKENKKEGREPEFYTFYSAKERNRALEKVAQRLRADKDDKDVFVVGDEIEDLQEDLSSEDMLMSRIFTIVGKAKQDLATKGTADLKELMDDIYQTYLFTTPERSVRRRMMHSQEMVGYSQDLLNHFSRQVTSYANQLSKMAFAGQIRMQIEGAKDNIKDRPATKQARLQDVIREMEARTEQEINPDPQSSLVNMFNRAAYIYYLTAPATAVIQTTSIPIRVVPRLWKDYGYVKGTAMWTKYMKVWQTLGMPRTETIKTGIGDQLHAIMPNVLGSKLINNDTERGKLLQRAARAGMERNVLETVTDTLLQNERETARRHREGLTRTAAEAGAQTAKAMGVMFQGMENITRQISYFMTFELAYDDFKAKNPNATEDAAFDHAVRQGLEVVRDALGEYSNWERPRIAKSNWTRALFLFKMHAIVQTKFLVQSFNAIVRGTGGDRVGALKELSGVMMMAGMFGGLMGLPLYSVMAWALAESFDDEDDEDVRKLMGIGMDVAVAYDSDIMFRKWIQDKFGNPEAEGIDLADILINGPIAALTNTELASRTSLDLKNMWFREGMGGDSTASSVLNALAANVAGASMAVSIARGYDDLVEGNIESGLKKIAPAFFRSWITTADQASRGVVDNKGNTIIPKEDIEAYDSARSMLGFRPMGLARWQDYYITHAKNDKRIDAEKTAILRKLDKKLREGDIATQQDFIEFWKEEIEPFNRTYPDRDYVITMESVKRSLEGREDVRARTYKGMQLDKKTAASKYEAAKGFMP